MSRYDFKIDEKAAFVYWLQAITDWNWYFNPRQREVFLASREDLSDDESASLDEIRSFLQTEGNGYDLLWALYAGEEMPAEFKRAREVFDMRFRSYWETEKMKLDDWKKALDSYGFDSLAPFFQRLQCFFGVIAPPTIDVKLVSSFDSAWPSGHSKKGFSHLLLLGTSSVSLEADGVAIVVGALLHETAHAYDYLSQKNSLLKEAYIGILKPLGYEQKAPSWNHLITESVICSIAGVKFDYASTRYLKIERNPQETAKLEDFAYLGNEKDYAYQMKSVAYKIKELTAAYLDVGKEMDFEFASMVVGAWVDFRSGK